MDRSLFGILGGLFLLVVIVVGGGAASCVAYKEYSVWGAQKSGEAEFAQAEQNRRISVEEARAKLDAAKLLASAEIERAKGVAESNRIVAEGLGGPDGYLRYLYINNLEHSEGQIIYVPTEAGLPILEAGKR